MTANNRTQPSPDQRNALQRDDELTLAKKILKIESDAVGSLITRIDDSFLLALDLVENCKGRVIAVGMGKSGIIARKLAATLSSTATAAYFNVRSSSGMAVLSGGGR